MYIFVVVALFIVGLNVFHHVVLPDESLAAITADKRFFAGVEAHVPPEVCLVIELLRANLALVWFVSSMLSQVLRVQTLKGKPLAALTTFKRLFARVEALVVLRQITGFIKILVALDTHV